MPLYADGRKKVRNNLAAIQAGEKPKLVKIGYFTREQITGINEIRCTRNLPPLLSEIVFRGSHLYRSRCVKDGYSIDHVLDQIENALSEGSEVDSLTTSTVLRNSFRRTDHKGNQVTDEAVFECTARYPYAELFSVIPKGDGRPRSGKAKGPLDE